MTEPTIFPPYIVRQAEEEAVLGSVRRVDAGTGDSRVVLLYGVGGSGKTQLIRHLAQTASSNASHRWLDPVDMDDPEFWLLSNLERRIARQLDPDNQFFGPYQDRLEGSSQRHTPLGYLRRVKRAFVVCYGQYIEATGNVPIIALDTMEAIRGTHLVVTITQWIKALPRSVFILSSRPPAAGSDRLKEELQDPHQHVSVDEVILSGFTLDGAKEYLASSGVGGALDTDQLERLAHLTQGRPLWLALTVDYLREVGLPEEAIKYTLDELRSNLPFDAEPTPRGATVLEEIKRRLLTPYRSTEFWHEAVKRLAIVRQSLDEETWRLLMEDREPPDGLPWSAAWSKLLSVPWVRTRGNGRQVTLHDVLAEELVWRIIPLHDQDGTWRAGLWVKARDIFSRSAQDLTVDTTGEPGDRGGRPGSAGAVPVDARESLIDELTYFDIRERTADQARAAALHYSLLIDASSGTEQFLDLFDEASRSSAVFLRERLALEMQRFLPPADPNSAAEVVPDEIRRYREWLETAGESRYLEVGMRVGSFLTETGQAGTALALLRSLPTDRATPGQQYRLANLLGNAAMRVSASVLEAERYFVKALHLCSSLPPEELASRKAEAHKELGFYYRNVGQWAQAESAYRNAVASIAPTLPDRPERSEREEIASVYTNWAYVKALSGGYREAEALVETAVKIRRRQGHELGLGTSLSVHGEILRYDRKFHSAWQAYEEARAIFESLGNWYWLGIVYQEEAICLFQAVKAGFPNLVAEPGSEARRRITLALDICRDHNARYYPSALNRAGRILGDEDSAAGLTHLADGIREAHNVADGWFYSANLIEYAELRYRRWLSSCEPEELAAIRGGHAQIEEAMRTYSFPDLVGRWDLLKAYLMVEEGQRTGDRRRVEEAVTLVAEGFRLIARSLVGSHGAAALPAEFSRLHVVLESLTREEQDHWYSALRPVWGEPDSGEATLLARLQDLYMELR